MLSAILAFIGALPGLGSVVQNITVAIANSKVAITTARIGGDAAVAKAIVQEAETEAIQHSARLSAVSASKVLLALVIMFAIPVVAFEWKVIIYDDMLDLGSTPALHGQVADWMNQIIYFLFGAPAALALGQMWFNRKTS